MYKWELTQAFGVNYLYSKLVHVILEDLILEDL